MKKFILVMAAVMLMLSGCKAKTEKVTDEQIQEAIEQCCQGDCDACPGCAGAALEDNECYVDENGEIHCPGETATETECCHRGDGCCKGEDCSKGEGCCEHKCCGANGGEKPQGSEEADAAQTTKKGQCTKCAKCQPCPMDINIPAIIDLVNKAKAAGKVTPELQKQYDALKAHASDCFECGACEGKCPNEVKVIETMHEAVKLFGK